MAENTGESVDRQGRVALEFWLVVIMLGVLCILVISVLFWPITIPAQQPPIPGKETTFKDVLDYRSNLLSIVITAFGAWVGAGAAYFFGRENLRVAADSLLAMRDVSPRERLRRTSIKQIPPTPIDWTVNTTTPIDDVKAKLNAEPVRWFVPVVKADKTLETIVNEEAVWRFLLAPAGQPSAGKTVQDLLTFIDSNADLKRFRDIQVTVTMETTVGAANDLMDSKRVFLAIVESEGRPTHFFTTSEVRKLLLQEGATR